MSRPCRTLRRHIFSLRSTQQLSKTRVLGTMAQKFVLLGMIAAGSLIPASAQNIFNCSSFASAGDCSVNTSGHTANFLIRNGGGLSGSVIDFIPAGSGHNGYGLWYSTPQNIQAFSTTFTFIPNGQNLAFVVQNTNNNAGYEGTSFASGAGCEGGFYQTFVGAANYPNNLFALEFEGDAYLNPLDNGFTYSSVQIYMSGQSPCSPNDTGPNFWPTTKFSTSPVPLNSPANAQRTATGDTYSATVTYDGSNVSLSLYDVTLRGSCPGASCYTHTWSNVRIPSLVGATTGLIGFAGGINLPNLPQLTVSQWGYTVNTPTVTPTSTAPVAGGTPATNPTFSPAAGTYNSAQTVSLSSPTSGAYICYSLAPAGLVITPLPDNFGNCAVGTLYSGPVSVPTSETLYAIAGTNVAGLPSGVAQAQYTIGQGGSTPQAATPAFSPAPGTYTVAQPVTISDTTSGATVYYTTDGTTPTTSSNKYSGAVTVSSTETLKAMATAPGNSNSAVASGFYTINLSLPSAAKPTFSPAAGTFESAQLVTLSETTTGATVYYTTDGTTPTPSSTEYSGSITVDATETLKAMAVAQGDANSPVASAAYTINLSLPAAATPTFSLNAGTYTSAQSVTISDATSDATIYYTTNGSTPTTSSAEYTGAITVNATETIQAVAVAMGDSNSAVATVMYTINVSRPSVATPTFSPVGGAYTSTQSVSISDGVSGAAIYYTTDGSTPTTSSTPYSGAIAVSSTETLQAIAVVAGENNSAIASAAYTIGSSLPSVATPSFSPAAGTYNAAQSVTIADATAGTTIYYTTDGSTPTSTSTAYTGPIAVNATETLQAIAATTSNSAVAAAAYTISAQPNFMLGTSVNSLAINSGGQGTLMVSVTPENGFSSPVVLACAGLPAWATCSFGESTVTPSGAAATTQLIISASPQTAALPSGSRTLFPFTALAMTVGFFGWRKRRGWSHWLLLAVVYGATGFLFGCSATSATGGTTATPNATSTVTVTAISGTLQGSAAIAITVN